MQSRPFNFRGEAGQVLAGTLDVPDARPRAWALFAHCFTCTRNSLAAARVSRALAGAGFGVLRFDFTGLGHSGGAFADSSFSGSIADLRAAAEAMRAAGHPLSLLVGHSLGGAAVLAAAGRIAGVAAVATIAAPADVQHVRHLFSGLDKVSEEGDAEVSIGGRPFRLRRGFLDDLANHDLKSIVAGLKKPLLVLHSPVDRIVGIDNASAIFMAARHPKSFVSLDGADHLLTRGEDASFVAAMIAAWAERYVEARFARPAEAAPGNATAVNTGDGDFQVKVTVGGTSFLADEPPEVGGLGSGPTPFEILSAALAACTAMTASRFAARKGLALERVTVEASHSRRNGEGPADLFTRQLRFEGRLSVADRQALLESASRCPVHKALEAGAAFLTYERSSSPGSRMDGTEPARARARA